LSKRCRFCPPPFPLTPDLLFRPAASSRTRHSLCPSSDQSLWFSFLFLNSFGFKTLFAPTEHLFHGCRPIFRHHLERSPAPLALAWWTAFQIPDDKCSLCSSRRLLLVEPTAPPWETSRLVPIDHYPSSRSGIEALLEWNDHFLRVSRRFGASYFS